MLPIKTFIQSCTLLTLGLALSACGGGGDDASAPSAVNYTVGFTVSGLTGGGPILQNNGGNNFGVVTNGSFTFAGGLTSGTAYSVTVSAQPAGQTCVVGNGSGTVSGNVTNITVTCTTITRTIGGTVAGLTGTVVLQNSGGNNLSVATNGSFTFSTAINNGTAYAVTVLTQPAGQVCSVAGGSGTASANVTNVAVNCSASTATTYTVGGGISGMTSAGLVLRLSRNGNVVETLPALSANVIAFLFATPLATGDTFNVTVATQPANPVQTCVVAGGSGTIAAANVSSTQVTCTTAKVTIGGIVSISSGTLAAGLVLQNGLGDDLPIAAGGTSTPFTFVGQQTVPSTYSVSIKTQPTGQTCAINRGLGWVLPVNYAPVTNVAIDCVNRHTVTPLSGTYALSIAGEGPMRAYMTFFLDGTYIFAIRNDNASCNVSGVTTNGNGIEYGVYDFNSGAGTLALVNAEVDSNGECGMFDTGVTGAFTSVVKVPGGNITAVFTDAPDVLNVTLTPVASVSGQLLGSWAVATRLAFVVFNNDGTMLVANAQRTQNSGTQQLEGLEDMCFNGALATAGSGAFTTTFAGSCMPAGRAAVDTNGPNGGYSNITDPINFSVTGDILSYANGGGAPVAVATRSVVN